jgi:hypothetical protein
MLLVAPRARPYTNKVPSSQQLTIRSFVQYCSSGNFPTDTSLLVPLRVNITLTNTNSTRGDQVPHGVFLPGSFSLPFQSQSYITKDGRCFQISIESVPVAYSFTYQVAIVNIAVSNPKVISNNYRIPQLYMPLPLGSLVVEASPRGNASILTTDPGQLVMVADIQGPQFVNCPDQNITVIAAPGELGTAATWDDILAYDSFGMAFISGSAYPGDWFSIAGSPHTVVYTAMDASGISSKCSFTVTATYAGIPAIVPIMISPVHDVKNETDFLGTRTYTDVLFEYDENDPFSFSLDAADYTSIAFVGIADYGARLYFDPQNFEASIYFEYDLRFRVTGQDPTIVPNTMDVFSSFSIVNQGPWRYYPVSNTIPQSLPQTTIEDGVYIRIIGRSAPIDPRSGMSFDGISIAISYPLGLGGSGTGPTTYELEKGSYLGFTYAYSDVPGQSISASNRCV